MFEFILEVLGEVFIECFFEGVVAPLGRCIIRLPKSIKMRLKKRGQKDKDEIKSSDL